MNSETESTKPTAITLLSLNIWNINQPFESRMSELVRFLRHATPHIVALQEVSRTSDGERQSRMIANEAGYDLEDYVRSGDWDGREEGLAVLTRVPSSKSDPITLPLASDNMPRVAQVVRADVGGTIGPVDVVNTHFSFPPKDTFGRLAQATTLIQKIRSHYVQHGRPIILCGDLNDDPKSAPVQRLFGDPQFRLRDAWDVNPSKQGLTYASSNEWARPELGLDRRIDYVAVSETLTVDWCTLTLTGKDGWKPVSDHYGVLAQISPHTRG